ncbi:vitamin K epoxide reductase complex subunit 1-like isoform X2 [Varroa jacobsoni]|uniref:vitamin-K-epoxide reductase (warfarin-sensitive) n=1 Tax=Varroa destructor TaxID=109461 RepID=A0A7M7MI02_VARDE|nr:vitamin K epoxide reductase complex subunit 1-like isoform X2 [Varroa destructor]XP_022688177.1 vitamin K epoxide reductase complex subunit 1-like isoform X2 [Varroa jacobsoni]
MVSCRIFCPLWGTGIHIEEPSWHITYCARRELAFLSRQPDYKSLCDLAEHISCSRVLTSEYSRGFGLLGRLFGHDSALNMPNCALGIVFYMILFCLGFLHQPNVLLLTVLLSFLANGMSLYLAAVLFFVLEDLCIVCVTTYIINAGLLVASAFRYVRCPKRAKERAFRSSLKKFN